MNAKLLSMLALAALAAAEEQAPAYRQLEAQAFDAAFKDKDLARAEALMAQAVEAATRSAGPAHPDTGRLLSYEALLLDRQNKPSAAEPLYQRAIAILEAPALALPVDLATALELYAAHLSNNGRVDEAPKLLDRARPIRARRVREMIARPEDAPAARAIGKDVTAPVVVYKVEPAYSDIARLAKYQGGVLMKIEIGPDGNVRALDLARGIGFGLDEKAAEALMKWKFKPGAVDGQPVAVKASVEINFRLQ